MTNVCFRQNAYITELLCRPTNRCLPLFFNGLLLIVLIDLVDTQVLFALLFYGWAIVDRLNIIDLPSRPSKTTFRCLFL